MRFYGQFEPPVDSYIFHRFIEGRSTASAPGVFIECGAFDGIVESSCLFFEETLGWRGFNIEASPAIFARLEKNRPRSTNCNVALSGHDGRVIFTDVHHPDFEFCTNGSVSHLPSHRAELDVAQCTYSEIEVPALTYRSFVDGADIEYVNLMVLDVEGHELSVIEGFAGSAALPEILCVEHGHLGLVKLRAVLEPLNYVYDSCSHVNSFFVRADRLVEYRG